MCRENRYGDYENQINKHGTNCDTFLIQIMSPKNTISVLGRGLVKCAIFGVRVVSTKAKGSHYAKRTKRIFGALF